MIHRGVRNGAEPLVRYLMWTMTTGACIGVSHGITTTANKRGLRLAAVFHDGMAGAIAGPWAPVFVPLVVCDMWPSKCPYINQKKNHK
jgi:hypothetical protein